MCKKKRRKENKGRQEARAHRKEGTQERKERMRRRKLTEKKPRWGSEVGNTSDSVFKYNHRFHNVVNFNIKSKL